MFCNTCKTGLAIIFPRKIYSVDKLIDSVRVEGHRPCMAFVNIMKHGLIMVTYF